MTIVNKNNISNSEPVGCFVAIVIVVIPMAVTVAIAVVVIIAWMRGQGS